MGRVGRVLPHLDLILVACFVVFGVLFLRSLTWPTRLDADEGINLMKARLVGQGYRLYSDIWNDQPPVFTHLLAKWSAVFGNSLAASRALVVVFSAAMLLAISRLTRSAARTMGLAPAAAALTGMAAMLLLLGSRRYVKLSVSVMIGLPAVAAALLSLWLLAIALRRNSLLLIVLSAAVFAVAMQIKLFVFMLLPVAGLMLLPQVNSRLRGGGPPAWSGIAAWWPAAAWSVTLLVGFLTIAAASYGLRPEQVFMPHVAGQRSVDQRLLANLYDVASFFAEDPVLTGVTVLAVSAALSRRKWVVGLPLSWLGTSLVALLFASPVWAHHCIMVYTPMAAAAALGLADLIFSADVTPGWRWAGRTALIGALIFGVTRSGVDFWKTAHTRGSPLDRQVVHALMHYRPLTRWIVTDHPLYAHVADMNVPPELAVMSAKRTVATGDTEDVVLSVLRRYRPELVLIARFRFDGEGHGYTAGRGGVYGLAVQAHLERHYRLEVRSGQDEGDDRRLYVRRDLRQ